jgi:hypothetical protein
MAAVEYSENRGLELRYLNPIVWGVEQMAAVECSEYGIFDRVGHIVSCDGRPSQDKWKKNYLKIPAHSAKKKIEALKLSLTLIFILTFPDFKTKWRKIFRIRLQFDAFAYL